MANTKRYYWLKLKEDFFDNLRMKKLRSIAGGDTYTIIYLKMQLLSLQNNGYLYYENVEDSFEEEISLLINENVEDVKITIAFLKNNNLIQEINEGEYELIETKTCIGSETDKAEFMRKLREKRNNEKIIDSNNVTNMLPDVTKCYTEKEKEKREKRKDVEEKLQQKFIECIGSTNLNAINECISYLDDMPYEVIEIALLKTSEKNGGWKYAKTILQNWLNMNINTVEQVKAEELKFKNKIEKPKEIKQTNYNNYEKREYMETDLNKFYANNNFVN